jgi:DHA1 family tetracycline resistance protein-like MFS transporter
MTTDNKTAAAQSTKLALTFIFIAAMLDSIGLGIIIPVWPKLIAEVAHENIIGAAWWGQWFGFVYAGLQFI